MCNMLEKMQELIADGLGVDKEQVVETVSFKDDLAADSLDLFELAMSMEEEFGVEIPSEELEKMVTVGDVMKYIESHQ
ncbi:MAG: acyl carrier protein [Lachnospiraceae bacterium]|nr:acyl carrier protein [Lachnospiraceae bacterium]